MTPTHRPRIGSLFSGVAGLDMALHALFDAEPAWFAEIDPAPSKVLAHRFPDVPNLGDVSAVDFSTVPPVDILCGGFPCQDVSVAGRRAGITEGSRSGLWSVFDQAIAALNPKLVIVENVRGLLSAKASRNLDLVADEGDVDDAVILRAVGAVLGDLADLGFDAEWGVLPASAVGAPHRRDRVFIVARPADAHGDPLWAESLGLVGGGGPSEPDHGRAPLPEDAHADAGGVRRNRRGDAPEPQGGAQSSTYRLHSAHWGPYADAVHRWEALTRPAPTPTEIGRKGNPRLNAAFAEWMMGWPGGWVTDDELGLTRTQQLKIIGNGVVTAQAFEAIGQLTARLIDEGAEQ